MKKIIALLAIVASTVFAVEPTIGPNALTNGVLNGNADGWTITGMPGGNSSMGGPGYTFSYQSGTIAQTYAINQALKGTGIQIHGFNYGFEYRFACAQIVGTYCEAGSVQDTLNTTITITNSGGETIYKRYYGLGSKNAKEGNSSYNPNWQSLATEQRFSSPYDISNMGTFTMSITGMDAGNWEGNYGPSVRQAYSIPVFTQNQCETNPLSSPSCPGYETAYLTQQCTANAMYSPSCPGYAAALLIQQCISNPLASATCPGYAEAYAKKNILNKDTSTTSETTTQVIVETVSVSPTSSTSSSTSQKVVTTNGAANPVAPVKLNSDTINLNSDGTKITQETKDKKLNNDSYSEPKTNREALAEKRREEVKTEIVNKGKELANNAGKAADIQAQAEIQNLVIQAMGHVAGFDVYSKTKMPDTQFYTSREVYSGQRNIDSPQGRRLFSGSDLTLQQMIEPQYNLGN